MPYRVVKLARERKDSGREPGRELKDRSLHSFCHGTEE